MSKRPAPSKGDRHESRGRVVFNGNPSYKNVVSIAPPKLNTGQIRCPACRNATRLRVNGLLRQHRDLFGVRCWNSDPGSREPIHVEAPPINLGIRGSDSTNCTPPDGHCQECSKPIPPMRRLCGRCMARRAR